MLLVDAACNILTERREDFLSETEKIIPVVRKEAGCTRYELLTDPANPGQCHFIEEWESRRHLDDHLARPHMKEYLAKTAAHHSAPTRLTVYEISGVQSAILGP
jgi:quinol monooxygenase YgiN